jgi:AbrB family looped-hinge helix DNA binding protein
MPHTVMSNKGQVIIPKAMRDGRLWRTGTRLEVLDTPDGVLMRPPPADVEIPLGSGLAAIRRRIAYAGPVVSLEAMDAALEREAARGHLGGITPLQALSPRSRGAEDGQKSVQMA